MRWFLLTASYQILHPDSTLYQFDEQVLLLKAESREEAFFKGKRIAGYEERSFSSSSGEVVRWKFLGITDLREIDELTEFVQVGSCTREIENPLRYIHDIKKRSLKTGDQYA